MIQQSYSLGLPKGVESSCPHKNLHRDVYSSFICNCLTGSNQDTLPASLVVQTIKNLPVIQGTQIESLGQEDPLEKKTATHSSILAWRIPRTEESGGLQSMGLQRVGHDWAAKTDKIYFSSVRSVQSLSCVWLCDPMDNSTLGFPVLHQLLELTQTHVHWVSDDIQPSHPLSSPSPLAFILSQHQGLFKWVSSSHQVAKVLEFQLQYQSFQWIFRIDFL